MFHVPQLILMYIEAICTDNPSLESLKAFDTFLEDNTNSKIFTPPIFFDSKDKSYAWNSGNCIDFEILPLQRRAGAHKASNREPQDLAGLDHLGRPPSLLPRLVATLRAVSQYTDFPLRITIKAKRAKVDHLQARYQHKKSDAGSSSFDIHESLCLLHNRSRPGCYLSGFFQCERNRVDQPETVSGRGGFLGKGGGWLENDHRNVRAAFV